MSALKSDEYLDKLDRKFARLLALTFIIDGIVGILLFFFIPGPVLIIQSIMFLMAGIACFYVFRKPEKKYMPHSLAPSITISIILSILGIFFVIFPPMPEIAGDMVITVGIRYTAVYIFSLDGIFILWTILLQRQKRKASSNKPVE